jgi:hypothetical protein
MSRDRHTPLIAIELVDTERDEYQVIDRVYPDEMFSANTILQKYGGRRVCYKPPWSRQYVFVEPHKDGYILVRFLDQKVRIPNHQLQPYLQALNF